MTTLNEKYHSLNLVYGESGNPFFAVDPGLTIWTWLVFFTLLLVLYKFAWKPILKKLDEREGKIKDSILNAERIEKELIEVTEKNKTIITQANEEAKKIMAKSKENAEKLREELETRAKADAKEIVDNAKKRIDLEMKKALEDLKAQSVNIAVKIASDLIKSNLDSPKNNDLAKEYLEEIEKS